MREEKRERGGKMEKKGKGKERYIGTNKMTEGGVERGKW